MQANQSKASHLIVSDWLPKRQVSRTKRALSKLKHYLRLSKARSPDTAASVTTINSSPSRTVVAPRSSVPASVPEGSQFNAPLESLPAEIRRQLLSTLKFEELRALVLASSVLHRQYLRDRRYLLCKCLETTLYGAVVDAFAVYQSSSADFSNSRTR
ncbi:uncharacterized protein MAM_04581 [Metarhizium album ARSEF 1941]|uniref:F-box domain-containing protein n=1 Tax=Metarhizium album (strain ARSEF 1941) TaxID=1081103 RepID=A0A0B2WND0_METAS|nr:uncharacterized protein MAM_04581 [Metarhizium album ARSEF 1941]KHN97566.1 hypothetical protein MAM_04581 [Metarhizium album ARSEF 1941]